MNSSRALHNAKAEAMIHNDFPPTYIPTDTWGPIPTDEACRQWWDEYGMLEHIKLHSSLVASVATDLAELAAVRDLGIPMGLTREEFIQSVRASGLLHDLGKTYSINHGGNHSQLGAAWVMDRLRNTHIAQGVLHHVHWPGELDPARHFLPLAIIYADKRVMHDRIVDVDERFEDLMHRYGSSERSRALVRRSHAQGQELERLFSTFLGEDIHEYPFDRRRLVR
jgi:hypothetical protein